MKTLLIIGVSAALALSVAACGRKGPLESAEAPTATQLAAGAAATEDAARG